MGKVALYNKDEETRIKNHRWGTRRLLYSGEGVGRLVVEMTSHSENQVTSVGPRIQSRACLLNQNFPHGMCPRNRKLAGFRSRSREVRFRRPFSPSAKQLAEFLRRISSQPSQSTSQPARRKGHGRWRSGREVSKQSVSWLALNVCVFLSRKRQNKRR